jgi:hypothetical protein
MFNQIKKGHIEILLFLPFICYHKAQIISMCDGEEWVGKWSCDLGGSAYTHVPTTKHKLF